MKLLSAQVRNYRIIRDSGRLDLQSPSGLSILGAPNESGKSTLVEAIHCALFLAHRTGGAFQKQMRSAGEGTGHPEVELDFQAGGTKYTLRKVFRGSASSSVNLTADNGTQWTGSDAEAKLAELTGKAPGNGNQLDGAWAHLWVWQGESGGDPLSNDQLPKDLLNDRLAREGGGAVLRSTNDSRVMALVEAAYGGIFTLAGRACAGSELLLAETAYKQALVHQGQAKQTLDRLETDIQAKDTALRLIAEARQGLLQIEPETRQNAESLKTLTGLHDQRDKAQPRKQEADNRLQTLQAIEKDITGQQAEADRLEKELEPAQNQVNDLLAQVREAELWQVERDQESHVARELQNCAQERQDLAQNLLDCLDRETSVADLEEKREKVLGLVKEIADLEARLAELAPVDAKALVELRNLDHEATIAEVSVRAMALELEVVRTDRPVRLGETELAAGDRQRVATITELSLGDGVVIRIHPGGGDALAEKNQEARTAREKFRQALNQRKVSSLDEAVRVQADRGTLDTELAGARRFLKGLGQGKLELDWDQAKKELAGFRGGVARLAKNHPDLAVPASRASAATMLEACKVAHHQAQAAAREAQALQEACNQRVSALRPRWGKEEADLQRRKSKLTELRGRIGQLTTSHGDAGARQAKLGAAATEQMSLEAAVQNLIDQIDALAPAALEQTRNRLERARQVQEQALAKADSTRMEMEGRLGVVPGKDPRAELEAAKEQAEVLQASFRAKTIRANGIRLLREQFNESARNVEQQVLRPLIEKVNSLVRHLYGTGAFVSFKDSGDGLSDLQLHRPGFGSFPFKDLSGGTREQMASAFRLALAELLAADHDGCLPVVLDDSFANCDSERLRGLQSLLDAAASRGLQVLVVTCDPASYAALGACQVDLSGMTRSIHSVAATTPSQPGQPLSADETNPDLEPDEGDNDALTIAATVDDQASFLAVLREAKGKSGNISLREKLGWPEDRYGAVQKALIDSKLIKSGRGKGGSVELVQPEDAPE